MSNTITRDAASAVQQVTRVGAIKGEGSKRGRVKAILNSFSHRDAVYRPPHIIRVLLEFKTLAICYMLMDSSDDDDKNENIPDPHFIVKDDGESKIIKL